MCSQSAVDPYSLRCTPASSSLRVLSVTRCRLWLCYACACCVAATPQAFRKGDWTKCFTRLSLLRLLRASIEGGVRDRQNADRARRRC